MVEVFNFYNEEASNAISVLTDVISSVASRTPAGAATTIAINIFGTADSTLYST